MDYAKIGAAIEQRKNELDRPWERIAKRAGLSTSTIWKARDGERKRDATYSKIDKGLDWPPGTLLAIGEGRMDPPTGQSTDTARLDALAAEVASLDRTVTGILQQLDQLVQQVRRLP